MKKFLSLFLCLTCVLTLVACGKKAVPITLPQTDEITSIDITFGENTVVNTILNSLIKEFIKLIANYSKGCKKLISSTFLFRQVFKNLLSCEYNRGGWNCKFYEHGTIVSQLAIQYDIINNRKEGAYYGNKKCKCNGSCAAGD